MTEHDYEYILIIDRNIKGHSVVIKRYKNNFKTMPKLNGTGPMGQGAGTGRGIGPCGSGMGMRRGCGCQGGYGFGFRRFISPKNELVALENEEKILEEELAAIKKEKVALNNQQK